MIALAPGKIVVSGAYAVLEGAPAIVVAVDRYATADTGRTPSFVTPEVQAAVGSAPAPWFNADPLREGDTKLGLGSSAAILVASLAAIEADARGSLDDATLGALVFDRALQAHRRAQGGGSGVDVAASCHGGTIVAERRGDLLSVARASLPASLHLEVWAAGRPASTPALLGQVRKLGQSNPEAHRRLLAAQGAASAAAAHALAAGSTPDFVAALREQCGCLLRLGQACQAPIVTDQVRALDVAAKAEGATVLPSGAGGGDIALYAGTAPPSPALLELAATHARSRLRLGLEARGVHIIPGD